MCDEIQERLPLSPRVVEAMSSVNREIFVPPAFAHLSYQINALPMVDSQWISSPLTVAQMTEYLAPNGGDSVLEIGCGSGYQAMVLSKMFRRVFSIERIDKLLCEAKDRFRALQVHNIFVKLDDGQKVGRNMPLLMQYCFQRVRERSLKPLLISLKMVA